MCLYADLALHLCWNNLACRGDNIHHKSMRLTSTGHQDWNIGLRSSLDFVGITDGRDMRREYGCEMATKGKIAEKKPGVLVDSKFNIRLTTNNVPWRQRKPTKSWAALEEQCQQIKGGDGWYQWRTGEPHLECWMQFWSPQYRMDTWGIEWIQWRTKKIIKGLKHVREGKDEIWDCSMWGSSQQEAQQCA